MDKTISNRGIFYSLIDDILENNKDSYQQYGISENPHVKTYFIESNMFIENIIKYNNYNDQDFYIKDTEDYNFYTINNSKNIIGLLDTSRKRIWQFYSLIKSTKSDNFIKFWINNSINLDHCWLIDDFLKKYENNFIFRGIGIKWTDIFSKVSNRNNLSIKLWLNREQSYYEDYSQKIEKLYNDFSDDFFRSSIRLEDYHDNESYILNEIFWDGKITYTNAKSSDYIINFNNNIINDYLKMLNIIENKRGLFGDPVEIIFKNDIDKQAIANYFLSGKLPFRLLLTKIEDNNSIIRLFGVDLHTNQDIGIDIGDDYIWINIPKNTCGNAGIRIPTLLGFQIPGKKTITVGGEKIIE